jgi:hypothetical protein
MKVKVVHAVCSFLLCAFWIGIYLFTQQLPSAIMASIFGSFGVVALGQLFLALLKRYSDEWSVMSTSENQVSNAKLAEN